MLETKEYAFLLALAKAGLLESQTIADVNNGKIKLVDTVQILRVEITGGSNLIDLLPSGTKYKKGVSDWESNKLPAKENLLCSVVRVGYGIDAAGITTSPAEVLYQRDVTSFPAVLSNASIIVKHDNKVIVKLPISHIVSQGMYTGNSVNETGYFLKALQLIKENSLVNIELEFPEGTGLGAITGKHYLEIALGGQKTAIK